MIMCNKNKGGRPVKYKTPEEMQLAHDSIVCSNTINGISFGKFSSEKSMVDQIEDNIETFMLTLFNDKYIKHEKEYPINKRMRMSARGKRIDLVIWAENNIYLIEVKNPQGGYALRSAIGQLLDYGREFSDPKKKMVLLSSKFDDSTAKTLDEYGLPISFVTFSGRQSLEYIGNA